MAETTEQALSNKVRAVFTDPNMQSKVVNLLVHNKPLGWHRRSNAPYYKEKYALDVKRAFDKMMETGKEQCYYYSTFREKYGIERSTLYTRIYQGARYLVEKMDTADGKYAKFLRNLIISRRRCFVVGMFVQTDDSRF